jgi:dolichol-phosphate mannosyltransferase
LSASLERRRAPVQEAQELIRLHGRRAPSFLFAGVVGLITTFAGTVLLYHGLRLPLWLASAIAIQLAILVTYTLNSLITWRDRRWGSGRKRFLTFEAVSLVGLGINEAVLLTSVDHFRIYYLLALFFSSGVASIWNYLANNNITFSGSPLKSS